MKKCKEPQCLTEMSENSPHFCPEHNDTNISEVESIQGNKEMIEAIDKEFGTGIFSIVVSRQDGTTIYNKEKLASFLTLTRINDIEEIKGKIKEYFGYIGNDGVTGKPMVISQEEIGNDILGIIELQLATLKK